jgi:hypothetical protein
MISALSLHKVHDSTENSRNVVYINYTGTSANGKYTTQLWSETLKRQTLSYFKFMAECTSILSTQLENTINGLEFGCHEKFGKQS